MSNIIKAIYNIIIALFIRQENITMPKIELTIWAMPWSIS